MNWHDREQENRRWRKAIQDAVEAERAADFEQPATAPKPEPKQPRRLSDVVSDTTTRRGNVVTRTIVFGNGTRIESSQFADGWQAPQGDNQPKPGSRGALEAFKAGGEEVYIDRMQNAFGGEF